MMLVVTSERMVVVMVMLIEYRGNSDICLYQEACLLHVARSAVWSVWLCAVGLVQELCYVVKQVLSPALLSLQMCKVADCGFDILSQENCFKRNCFACTVA